jgi:hypothetical protein
MLALSLGMVAVKAGCAGAPVAEREEVEPLDLNAELDRMLECAATAIVDSGQAVVSRHDGLRWVSSDWVPTDDGRARVTARVFAHPTYGAGLTFRIQREAWVGEGSADAAAAAAVGADGSGWDATVEAEGDAEREAELIEATRVCWAGGR